MRKTVRKMTTQKVQDDASDQVRKKDKFTKKAKGTDNTAGQTFHQDWMQMPPIQSSSVIGKNEDGSDITQDVDVLVWWRDVGQDRFPLIVVMVHLCLKVH